MHIMESFISNINIKFYDQRELSFNCLYRFEVPLVAKHLVLGFTKSNSIIVSIRTRTTIKLYIYIYMLFHSMIIVKAPIERGGKCTWSCPFSRRDKRRLVFPVYG